MNPAPTEFDPYKGDTPPHRHDRDAIIFATERLEEFEGLEFLRDYLKADLTSWPEYIDFLAERQVKGATNG